MNVWEGESIWSVKTVKHPNSTPKDGVIPIEFDLALIKLKRPAPLDTNSNGQITNNIICLPSKDFKLKKQSLAMIAGHGMGLTRTTIGSVKLRELKYQGHLIHYRLYFGGQQTCSVSFKML